MSASNQSTVFVTGADKGLGYALVKTFLAEGFIVFAGLYDSASDLSDLNSGGRLHTVALDVSQMDSIKAAAQQVKASGVQLDILFNNAGIYPKLENLRPPLEEEDLDDGRLEAMMAVNAFGPIRMIQQFLPLMKADGMKRLTTISSEAGSIAECWRDSEIPYCMSKGALNRGLQIINHALAPKGFQLLVLHPGWLRTDMGGETATDDPMDAARKMVDLCLQDRGPEAHIYLNFDGREIDW